MNDRQAHSRDADSSDGRTSRDRDEVALLLKFLHDRDVPCPRCGYNLRNLVHPRCPECKLPVALTVGLPLIRFGWVIVLLAPSIFSAIMTLLVFGGMLIAIVFAGQIGPLPAFINFAVAFGVISTGAAIGLYAARYRFIALPILFQALAAAGTWIIHIGAFVVTMLLAQQVM